MKQECDNGRVVRQLSRTDKESLQGLELSQNLPNTLVAALGTTLNLIATNVTNAIKNLKTL